MKSFVMIFLVLLPFALPITTLSIKKEPRIDSQDPGLKSKEKRDPTPQPQGEFPNVGPGTLGNLPKLNLTVPQDPFFAGHGQPFMGHGPEVVSTPYLSTQPNVHAPSSTKNIHVSGRPSSVSIPRINLTSGNLPGPQVTPVIEWIDCNGNFVPPSSLNLSYFTSSCNATSTSRAVPRVTPVIEWIDCNGNFIPPSLLNSSYFTSSCIASSPSAAFSAKSPLPEWIGSSGNFVYPSTVRLPSLNSTHVTRVTARVTPKTTPILEPIGINGNFVPPASLKGSNSVIHIASSTAGSTYKQNTPVSIPRKTAFNGPKRRRNGREGLAVYD